MISILIPVYNRDVNKLVVELADQANRAKVPFEILAFDDASRPKYLELNRPINQIFGVNYVESEQNLGRARMRNRLARTASMDYLLFLDCDVKIPNRTFIKRYADLLREKHPVITGGIAYSKRRPGKNKRLHWLFGRKREALPARKRRRAPHRYLMTANMLIRRDVYLETQLDETLSGYGHEDTLYAYTLQQLGIHIHHTDNPIRHLGLEDSKTFLKKQAQAIYNLAQIQKDHPGFETRLSRFYDSLKKYRLLPHVMRFIARTREARLDNLLGPNPSLRSLDLYKLDLYHQINNE